MFWGCLAHDEATTESGTMPLYSFCSFASTRHASRAGCVGIQRDSTTSAGASKKRRETAHRRALDCRAKPLPHGLVEGGISPGRHPRESSRRPGSACAASVAAATLRSPSTTAARRPPCQRGKAGARRGPYRYSHLSIDFTAGEASRSAMFSGECIHAALPSVTRGSEPTDLASPTVQWSPGSELSSSGRMRSPVPA